MAERFGDPPSDREWIRTLEQERDDLRAGLEAEVERLKCEGTSGHYGRHLESAMQRQADRLSALLEEHRQEVSGSGLEVK